MQFKSNMMKKIITAIMAFTLLAANMTLPIYAESSEAYPIVKFDLPNKGDN